MPIFSGKFRPPARSAVPKAPEAPEASPPTDQFVGDRDALRLRDELAAGRWQHAHDFLEPVRDWRLRNFYVNALANVDGRPWWIDEWAAARPESGLALLFSGWHRVDWAWQARGGGRAKTVQQDAWPVFHERLVAADRDLTRSAALDRLDPTPVARSIWVAMGLSLGQAEVRRRFDEASRREHLNQGACYAMIQATARKWGGSHEAMFGFARWVAQQAPDGSPCHKMIALAHVERWLDAPKEDKAGYFLDPAVKAEVHEAATRSVWSPRYPSDSVTWADRNAFAFCFWLMRDYAAAAEQIRLIGPRVTPAPWHYLGAPGRIYAQAWQESAAQSARSGGAGGGRPSL